MPAGGLEAVPAVVEFVSASVGEMLAGDAVASGCCSAFAVLGLIFATFTRPTPLCVRPISLAARSERSSVRPRTCGPRSLIRTTTDFPVVGFVTFAYDPRGRCLDAAVRSSGS